MKSLIYLIFEERYVYKKEKNKGFRKRPTQDDKMAEKG